MLAELYGARAPPRSRILIPALLGVGNMVVHAITLEVLRERRWQAAEKHEPTHRGGLGAVE